MALNKITNKEIEEKQVASLPDRMTGTAAENKAAFDALTKALIAKYNELVDTLMGQGGAAAIGSAPFAGADNATTVRAQLIKLQDNIAAAVSGDIADGSLSTTKLKDNAITTAKIADGAVTTAKLGDGEIVNAKIRDLTIETSKLANESVTEPKLAEAAVTTEKIADGAVTAEKLAASAIEAAGAGRAYIHTGRYAGSGASGASAVVSVTLPFVPDLMFVFANEYAQAGSPSTIVYSRAAIFNCMRLTSEYKPYGYNIISHSGFYDSRAFAKLDGMTLSWYYDASSSANSALNAVQPDGYYYIALGLRGPNNEA